MSRASSRRYEHAQEHDMRNERFPEYSVGDTSSDAEERDDTAAQLWLPDPGERRGWSLYHVWRERERGGPQYGLRARQP